MSLLVLRMSWLLDGQETIDPHQLVSSSFFKVWKWDCEIYFSRTCIVYDCELEAKLWRVVGVTLVERPFVVHRDFGIVAEEVGNAI